MDLKYRAAPRLQVMGQIFLRVSCLVGHYYWALVAVPVAVKGGAVGALKFD
jgi:hypothetical protein